MSDSGDWVDGALDKLRASRQKRIAEGWPGITGTFADLVEDEEGAPLAGDAQTLAQLKHWLEVGVQSADNVLKQEVALPTDRHREKLVAFMTTKGVYEEALAKLAELERLNS